MVSPRSTHAVTFLHNWELPFGKGRRYLTNTSEAVDAVAGGWRLSGINTLYSGVVFTPTISNAPRVNADFNYFRPDIIGSPSVFESKCSSVVQLRSLYRTANGLPQWRCIQGISARPGALCL